MNEETKKRIAAINSGIIPEGYKKTKVGTVPVEWEEKIGTDLFEYIRNGFVGTVSPFYVSEGHKYIQGNNIKDGRIVSDNLMYVNDEFYNSHKNSILKTGDIIIIQSGDVGKCALVKDEYENANCHALIIMTPYPTTNTFFISYLLNSPLGFEMIKGFVTGNALHHILASDYKELKYILPPLHEQQKIAEILSTQDKLIELQEKKIEQLKELKKAYLQKMFPKKGSKYPELRFKGFAEPWEQRKLSEVSECLDSMRVPLNANERSKMQGDIPYYGAGSIQDYINQYLFDEELVLLLEDGDAFDDFKTKSIAQYICGKSWVNNHAHILRPKGDAFFLFISLAHKDIRNVIQLAGASRKKLVQDAMLRIIIDVPSVDEQKKIGAFFKGFDSQINLHQSKLEQEKQKKKALMQLLLTGKVRCK